MLLDESRTLATLGPKEKYIEEKITRVDSLTLVLTGRLSVSQQGSPLHSVVGSQFLESPEWFGVANDHYFQVSVMAVEESLVVVWHRDKLKFFLGNHPDIEAIFDHVLGRDVVRKLIEGQGIHEDKSFVVKKKPNHFLASFLGEKSNMKLGKIAENEDESLV